MVILAVTLVPALGAVWIAPGFVTQDGPAHLYNAQILLDSLRPDSPFAATNSVHWNPLPNWAGHVVLMALLRVTTPDTADRAMISLTLVSFAVATLWLRWRVRGAEGGWIAVPWSALVAMNVTWLFGFSSFLFGASLFAVSLGVWWEARNRLTRWIALGLGALLTLGYFSHPISLGWTILGLLVLCAWEQGPGRARRWARTLLSLVPTIPLAVLYRRIMRQGGSIEPIWGILGTNPLSFRAWKEQVGWVDPLTLGRKLSAPFVDAESPAFVLATPVLWFGAAAAVLIGASVLRRHQPDTRSSYMYGGWALLAGILLGGGLVSPDTLGPRHGNYLAQRTVLLGLVALLPALNLERGRISTRFASVTLVIAVVLQTAFVWDYARRASPLVTTFLRAKPACGRGQRIGALMVELKGRYRVNPLLHLDSLLGLGTGNIIWGNYESAFYYFPVQIRQGVSHPPVLEFEEISRLDGPGEAVERARRWNYLLARHGQEIDVLVVWGDDPGIDRVNNASYRLVFHDGKVRVWHRREGAESRKTGDLDRIPPSG